MTSNVEQRLFRLESELRALLQWKASVDAQLALLSQQQYAQLPGSGGGGGSGPIYYGCTLSAALAHGSSVTGQTVWTLNSGSRTTASTTATIYNDAPNAADDISSGKQIIVVQNGDGTFTVVAVPC